MSDSSDEERSQGYYQPVAAIPVQPATGGGREPGATIPTHVYTNELFRDGDVLAGPPKGRGATNGDNAAMFSSPNNGLTNRPGSAGVRSNAGGGQKSLAAKRQERLQSNLYEPNELQGRSGGSAMGPAMGGNAWANGSRVGGLSAPSGDANSVSMYGLQSSYDPNEETQGSQMGHAGGGSQRANQQQQQQHHHHSQQQQLQQQQQAIPAPVRLDLSDMPSFLMTPGPKHGPIQCYIVRDKGTAKMYPKYNLFLEQGKRFLLAARKRKKQTTSNYLISRDLEDMGRDSDTFFGKLRSNFVGTDFSVFDDGDKPGKGDETNKGRPRAEVAAVMYQYNVLGTRGPRKMTAAIPNVDELGERLFSPRDESDGMLERVKCNNGVEDIVIMRNKAPRWNEELNAYCLNFNGRVTEASVKNFQLVTDDSLDHVICQFGKIGKNVFTMDYQWPICALQAFGICLSSFDNKLACE